MRLRRLMTTLLCAAVISMAAACGTVPSASDFGQSPSVSAAEYLQASCAQTNLPPAALAGCKISYALNDVNDCRLLTARLARVDLTNQKAAEQLSQMFYAIVYLDNPNNATKLRSIKQGLTALNADQVKKAEVQARNCNGGLRRSPVHNAPFTGSVAQLDLIASACNNGPLDRETSAGIDAICASGAPSGLRIVQPNGLSDVAGNDALQLVKLMAHFQVDSDNAPGALVYLSHVCVEQVCHPEE